jgi:4-diphosphocytidyl-2-C-methyl-D-erythritol kinase
VVVRAPAKLNLHLSVGRLREDGFHDLTTVYQAVGVYDEVELTRGPALTVDVTGPGSDDVPRDASNLAARAVALLAERTGNDARVRVSIRKQIPVAGGCAGGSADAAAALVGCDALWGLGLTRDELDVTAAELGSDVPFAVHGGTAVGTGRGEQVAPVLGQGSYSWVLAVADGGLSTPAVYAELDRQRDTGPVGVVSDPAEVVAALRTGDSVLLGRALRNDLQSAAVALRPQLGTLLASAEALDPLGVVVSGSGPTVAVLARDDAHAEELAGALRDDPSCRAVLRASAPVPGARVVEEH